MHLRYVFSELGQGLRRNLSMHVAVVLTLFVSLTLVGLGFLLNEQTKEAEDYWGSQLQITVFLCTENDPNVKCVSDVTDAQRDAVLKVVEDNPEVAGHHEESKQEAFDKVKKLLGEDLFEGPNPPATAEAMQETVWIELKDPKEYEGIVSAVIGLDGVSGVRDLRDELDPIYSSIDALKYGAWGIAIFLVLAALLLVGNTIRLAAFARRKEIGIMRLVGASSLYITLPFLLEALVTALIGVALAATALLSFWFFVIDQQVRGKIRITPWIGFDAVVGAVFWVTVLAVVISVVPTLLLTRKYIKV
ncbi:permease-like cell division protein FtsX [Nocardioides speluncae]|uniref:permease-like cell division protein FtsX n=1 Tax=Nocardioides speluncae TaxID=2670337 RepID=UPI000D694D54|nr:permease-like cell division protein FtsX [Nocardioides speluncae]